MKIGIVIPTYQRPDGKTPFYLKRALDSIKSQTFSDYNVFVIGDAYADVNELTEIVSAYPRVFCFNLDRSIEREKYPFGDHRLWCVGGLTAGLAGISFALNQGLEYICHLDHDDWWEPNHLESVNRVIVEKKPLFVCTLSTYKIPSILPLFKISNEILEFYPLSCGLINSSSCVKYSETSLRARDCFAETGSAFPGDADLWYRLAEDMKITGKKGYVITLLTCHHDEECYTIAME